MPLITCPDCGSEISDRAPACPKCGAPQAPRQAPASGVDVPSAPEANRRGTAHGVGYWIGTHKWETVLIVIVLSVIGGNMLPTTQPNTAGSASRDARDEATTRALAGAKALKSMMRDPDSFKVEQALVTDEGAVCYSYRSKNGFGGMNLGNALLPPKVDRVITDDAPDFLETWGRHCNGKTGRDASAAIRIYG